MININIKPAIKSLTPNTTQSAFIQFPYDNELLNIVREQPGRYWHAQDKLWEIPLTRLARVIGAFGNREISITGVLEDEEPIINSYDLPEGFSFKTTPYQHQLDGFQYGIEYARFFLGDEQGLGKTKQVIDIAVAKKLTRGYKHCLIVAGVNGLKWNWFEEIRIHSDETSYIIGQRFNGAGKVNIGGNKEKLADLHNLPEDYFLIINVEALRDKAIADQINKFCKSGEIPMVAIDEIHKCKNAASQQGKGILKLESETRIAMTGTPVINNPLDSYIILRWLGFEFHNFYAFKKHYCVMGGYGGYEIIGYRNMAELKERLEEIMLRRLKKDVLDLPAKIYCTEYVEMGKAQKLIYDEVKMEIKSNIDQIKIGNNPLAQLIRLRQATGYTGILSSNIVESAKLDRMDELVEDYLESGNKVIIYSQWTQITDQICRRLDKAKIRYALITGQNSSEENHRQEQEFQNDPEIMVCVGTIGALGTGFTLTAATREIFLDDPWSKKTKEQAEDRAHRIGTKEPLIITTLITRDSIDERIQELVYKKGVMSDLIVDGDLSKIGAETIDYLLS